MGMKSLFWRYLTLTMLLLLVTFTLFGVSYIVQSYTYTLGQLQTMLDKDSQNVASLTGLYFDGRDIKEMQLMFIAGLRAILYENDEQVLVCSADGQLLLYANREGFAEEFSDRLPEDIIAQVAKTGSFREIGKLGGTYPTVHYTSGRAVYNESGTVEGYIFVSASPDSARDMFEYYQRFFFIIGIVVLMIGMCVSYAMARSMTKPLRAMTKATRAYAMGDFSVRIPEDRADEIGELAHSLNQMSASLNKLEELRSSFIANVSHELKTPMTTIAGFADGILDGTIPPEKEREYLTIISNDTRRLSRLVVRMLEASRLSAGEIQLHPTTFNICEMVRLNILEFEGRIESKGQSVDIDFEEDDMYVVADQDNIAQVVYNLLDNACKYGSEGGILRVSITRDGVKTLIAVANTGREIPADMLPYIFDRFYKTDQSRGVDSNSMGLGLFIVKSVLNMHGEDITASSRDGATTFQFTLPTAQDKSSGQTGRWSGDRS